MTIGAGPLKRQIMYSGCLDSLRVGRCWGFSLHCTCTVVISVAVVIFAVVVVAVVNSSVQ